MANFIGGIIALTIGVIVMVNVFLTTVHAVNTTGAGWTTSEASLFGSLQNAELKSLKKTGKLKSQSEVKSLCNSTDSRNAYSLKLEREYNGCKRQGSSDDELKDMLNTEENNSVMQEIKNFCGNNIGCRTRWHRRSALCSAERVRCYVGE